MQRGEGSETERQRERRWCSRFVGRRQRSPGCWVWVVSGNQKQPKEVGMRCKYQEPGSGDGEGNGRKKRGCAAGCCTLCTPCSSNKGGEVSGLQGLWKKRRAKKKVDESLSGLLWSLAACSGPQWSPVVLCGLAPADVQRCVTVLRRRTRQGAQRWNGLGLVAVGCCGLAAPVVVYFQWVPLAVVPFF